MQFQNRFVSDELMDDLSLDAGVLRQALRGLSRLNVIGGSSRAVWPAIRSWANSQKLGELRILDIACGLGDVTTALATAARREGYRVAALGLDINPNTVALARERLGSNSPHIQFERFDALTQALPAGFNVIVCSLFLHHLKTKDAATLIRRMNTASSGIWIVNDLVRHPLSYGIVWVGTHLFSRSQIVRSDGLASVRAAFRASEIRTLLQEAGIEDYRITRKHFWRMLVVGSGTAGTKK